jgi:hypothetical protein
MKTYEGVVEMALPFLNSALRGGQLIASQLGRFTPRERASVPGGWKVVCAPQPVWTRWNGEKFLLLSIIEPRPSRPSLYRLSYKQFLKPYTDSIFSIHNLYHTSYLSQLKKKVKLTLQQAVKAHGLWDVEAPTHSRQSAHRWRWIVSLMRRPPFTPRKIAGSNFC